MIDKRTFYNPVMIGSHYRQVYIPLAIVNALEIKDRDEVEIEIRKTGRRIERKRVLYPYGRKHTEDKEKRKAKEEFERMTPEERAAKELESMQNESEIQESRNEVQEVPV